MFARIPRHHQRSEYAYPSAKFSSGNCRNFGQANSRSSLFWLTGGNSTAAVKIFRMCMASESMPPGMIPPRLTINMASYSVLNCVSRWSTSLSTSSQVNNSRRICCKVYLPERIPKATANGSGTAASADVFRLRASRTFTPQRYKQVLKRVIA